MATGLAVCLGRTMDVEHSLQQTSCKLHSSAQQYNTTSMTSKRLCTMLPCNTSCKIGYLIPSYNAFCFFSTIVNCQMRPNTTKNKFGLTNVHARLKACSKHSNTEWSSSKGYQVLECSMCNLTPGPVGRHLPLAAELVLCRG